MTETQEKEVVILAEELEKSILELLPLLANPPYLAPKGAFKGQQTISPGKIIEYDSSLLPTMPREIDFVERFKAVSSLYMALKGINLKDFFVNLLGGKITEDELREFLK